MVANVQAHPEMQRLKDDLAAAQNRITLLEQQIEWLKKQLFGCRKSEKMDPAQLELLLQGLEAQLEQTREETAIKIEYERAAPKKRESRERTYGHLPVLEERVIEPEEVKEDPESFERVSEEETFEVDVQPPKFFRRRIVYPKYRRKWDRASPLVVAPAPVRPVAGIASIGLLVYIVISKYLDHLPLERQCRIYKRSGVRFSPDSMVRWVEVIADWLKPIYSYMHQELLEKDFVQVDETPIKYCDPDIKKGKSQKGFLCGMSRPRDNVVFAWATSRSEDAVTVLLQDYRGRIQCDAYAAYKSFAKNREEIQLIGCMAHVRRKFKDCLEQHPRQCALVLRLIGQLYHYERLWKEQKYSPKLIQARRSSESAMTLKHLYGVIEKLGKKELPKSKLGEACQYALNQRPFIERYLEHGEVPIDNNTMEQAIRPSALGKRNWNFIGSPRAGDRPAIIYSILISCERFGHDPSEYLKDVLHRLTLESDRSRPRDPASLTPRNWSPTVNI